MTRPIRLRLLAPILAVVALSNPARAADDYRAEVERFRQAREASLKADDGWLTVSGLAWVRPGETRIGGDPSADVLLPGRTLTRHERREGQCTQAERGIP